MPPKTQTEARRPRKIDWDAIKTDLEAGTPVIEVSKRHKVQTRTIRKTANAEGWKLPKTPVTHTKPDPSKHPIKVMGRPTKCTPAITGEICARIVAGEALANICKDPAMPDITTVYRWLNGEDTTFATAYAHARLDQADTLADEIITIADTEVDPNRAKVRIDARKWTASKLKPQRYGEKLDISGEISNKITAIRRIIVDDGAEIEGIEVHRAQALESVSQLPEK